MGYRYENAAVPGDVASVDAVLAGATECFTMGGLR